MISKLILVELREYEYGQSRPQPRLPSARRGPPDAQALRAECARPRANPFAVPGAGASGAQRGDPPGRAGRDPRDRADHAHPHRRPAGGGGFGRTAASSQGPPRAPAAPDRGSASADRRYLRHRRPDPRRGARGRLGGRPRSAVRDPEQHEDQPVGQAGRGRREEGEPWLTAISSGGWGWPTKSPPRRWPG